MAYARYKDKEKRRKYHRKYMRRYMRVFRAKCKREGRPYWDNKLTEQLKQRVMDVLGGPKCINCGCKVLSILEINHINGGGNRGSNRSENERKKNFRKIISGRIDRKLYNVLCRVCNAMHYVAEILGIKGHIVVWKGS
jgi:hypothetical protein